MDTTLKNTENTSGGSNGDIPRKFNISGGEDLPDNPHDQAKLEPKDNQSIRNATMDNEDAKPLSEEGFGTDVSGSDLDISGADAD